MPETENGGTVSGPRRKLQTMVDRLFGDITPTEFHDLLTPQGHATVAARRRAQIIATRAHMVAAVFALLTPLWIVVDLAFFEWPLWGWLTGLRVLATGAFLAIALSFRNTDDIRNAHLAMTALFSIPVIFFLVSHPLLSGHPLEGYALTAAAGYAFLPFVMAAGLAVFPITLIEGIFFSAPLVGAMLAIAFLDFRLVPFTSYLGAVWLLTLTAVVATLSGMSQLHFMMALVNQASHDGLTRAYNRRVGEELINVQFLIAQRNNVPLSVAFVDLDKFKSVNDQWGHEEGDKTLKRAAQMIRKCMRRHDIMIRWGGEEFLIVMPNTNADGARTGIERLRAGGLGERPDGKGQTASIGIAERAADGALEWTELVDKADHRMYMAKQQGRDRVFTVGDLMFQ